MKIKQLTIQNYKSIKELKIVDPAPFLAFIGANGVGKSNIFEAVEFMTMALDMRRSTVIELFGGWEVIANKKLRKGEGISFSLEEYSPESRSGMLRHALKFGPESGSSFTYMQPDEELAGQVLEVREPTASYGKKVRLSFSRIFVGQTEKVKLNIDSSHQLKLDGSNLPEITESTGRRKDLYYRRPGNRSLFYDC